MRSLSKKIARGALVGTLFFSNCVLGEEISGELRLSGKEIHPGIKLEDGVKDFKLTYFDFSKLDFARLERGNLTGSKFLKDMFGEYYRCYKDSGNLQRIIHEDLDYFMCSEQEIKELSPQEAIDLAVRVSGKRIQYVDVDRDTWFLQKYGARLPIDVYLELGQGDCERYAYYFKCVFDYLKERNSRLKNFFISDSAFGGDNPLHAWNSIVVSLEEEIVVSHIDPTHFDGNGKLEAYEGYHLPASVNRFAGKFLERVDPLESFIFYDMYLREAKHKEDVEQTLINMSFLARELGDKQKINYVIKKYGENFGSLENGVFKINLDKTISVNLQNILDGEFLEY